MNIDELIDGLFEKVICTAKETQLIDDVELYSKIENIRQKNNYYC